jgi:nucleotide-binding universal stress UspA family protein
MKKFTLLALQGPDGTHADLAPLANAASDNQGRLSVLLLGPVPILVPSIGAAPYAMPIIPEGWLGERNAMSEKLGVAQEKTREYLQKMGLTGEVATICIEPTAMHDLVAKRALFADISIVQDSLRNYEVAFDNVVYGLLFEAPGPVMLNVTPERKALAPENVLIAWNNSLPAARAVRAALPILKAAKEITIGMFDADPTKWGDGEAPGADLAVWLSHHGCQVTVQEYATGRKSVSDAILERAQERVVDLVVMGAYGRRRWQERIFGGTTQSMIQQRDVAVLLAH